MNDYLIEREILGQFIDELIKQKPSPVATAAELSAWREKQMKLLDDRITAAIFGSLNEEQLVSVNQLLDQPDTTPDTFFDFFRQAGVDLPKLMTSTMTQFGREFLGGEA